METPHRSPLRLIAPVALVLAALALVLVVSSSGGSGDGGSGSAANSAEKARDLGQTPKERRREQRRQQRQDKLPNDVYIVKEGDTLGGIAQTTGVPVERLQELNPGLDQFQLTKGQRIKLR
jgi:LysM repeat protein